MKYILCSVVLLCLISAPSFSAEEPSSPSPAVAEDTYPGLAEVAAKASEVSSEASQVETQLKAFSDIKGFENQLDQAERTLDQVQEKIRQFEDPAMWSVDRLVDVRGLLQENRGKLQNILQPISTRLGEIDRLRESWDKRKTFWREWEKHLTAESVRIPQETFRQAQETIGAVLKAISDAAAPLVVLQEELTRLLNLNQGSLTRVDSVLKTLRGQTFQRTGLPLFSPDFYRQFNSELVVEVEQGIDTATRIDLKAFQGQGWIIAVQILMAIATAGFILRHRREVQETREWRFILLHPWATGIFAAMALFSPLYTAPPSLLRLVLWVLTAFSASVLISGIVRNPLKRFTVYLLATLLVISLALQLVALPVPLYRLYLAALCLLGMPLGWLLARYNIVRHQGKLGLFSLGLKLGALVCLVSFLAQTAGYTTLASRLVDASIKSVFIGIFAMMAVRLGEGGVDFLLDQPLLRRRVFVQRFGRELGNRLKRIFVFLVWVGAFYNFLAVWGVYDSFVQAWGDLTSVGVTVGQVQVTVAMVLLALLVIYLAIELSWVLRATLETQIFPYRQVDRGVSDSIKKLLHYLLVFLGFLMAMSLAGIELKNFAVLAGAFGIGIGFGLQNIVNNFVSGLILLFERPVKVGDMVVVDNEWGNVRKIGLRSTVIETFDQSELIVPNSRLISETVTNWTFSTSRSRVVLTVGTAYGSDLALVLKILLEAAQSHELVLDDPAPSPIFVGFGESSLDFELRCWIADVGKRFGVRSDLGQFIDRRFREEGVEIPFPQRDLHLRSVDGDLLRKVAKPKTGSKSSPAPEASSE